MVYEKKRSGDPDYDDKQPPEHHAGGLVVSAGDGVILSKTNGPVDENGAHVNLAVTEEDQDNRPAPGEVATAASSVQQYREEDTPAYGETVEADSADVAQVKAGQASVQAANDPNVQDSPAPVDEPAPPAKSTKSTTSKTN